MGIQVGQTQFLALTSWGNPLPPEAALSQSSREEEENIQF